jgi:hypothetical protein
VYLHINASISCRSRVSRAVLSSPNSAIDAPSDSVVVTTAVTTQALNTFIGQLLREELDWLLLRAGA